MNIFSSRQLSAISLIFLCFFSTIFAFEEAETAPSFQQEAADHPYHFPQEPSPFPFDAKQNELESEQFTASLLKMLGTLGLLILLMYIASRALKGMLQNRVQNLNAASSIKIIEQRPLSNKAAIHLVEINEQQYIIGESPHGLTIIQAPHQE